MSRSIRIHHGAAFAAAAALAAAMLPGLAAAQVPSSQVPDELKVVIQQYIEDQGHEFAGFCDDVNANPDGATPGTYCAMVGSIEHEIAEVFYGPVFSDEISMVSFHFENGEWTLMEGTTPTPTTPASPTSPSSPSTPHPPATGTGTDGADSGAHVPFVLGASLAAIAALGAAGMVAVRKR